MSTLEEAKMLFTTGTKFMSLYGATDIISKYPHIYMDSHCDIYANGNIQERRQIYDSVGKRWAPIISKPTNENKMEDLKITKDRILDAAANCPIAKETLKRIFPEVFEDDKYFDLKKLSPCNDRFIVSNDLAKGAGFSDQHFMTIAEEGEYKGKGFYINDDYNWEIKRSHRGNSYLVPTKK